MNMQYISLHQMTGSAIFYKCNVINISIYQTRELHLIYSLQKSDKNKCSEWFETHITKLKSF